MLGIKRKRILGIARQSAFGTPAANAQYWLPCMDFSGNEEVIKIENEAWTGSRYKANDAVVVRRLAKPSFTIKLDEKIAPLFFLSLGSITSAPDPSDSDATVHTMTLSTSNTPAIYTLFLDDQDRQDLVYPDFRIEKIDVKIEKNSYITAEISGLSKYPIENLSFTPTLAQWQEFTSAHASFRIADYGGSLSTINLLDCSLSLNYGMSGDDVNYNLGSTELNQSFNTESDFTCQVSLLYPDLTYKTKWKNDTKQAFEIKLEDTSRYIPNTTINPSVVISFPYAYLSEWKEEGGSGDILRQSQTIKILDGVGINDTPIKITVKNNVANYNAV